MKSCLIWDPGASISTKDVAAGLLYGLQQHGIDALHYNTEVEVEVADVALSYLWRKHGGPEPTSADKYYRAAKAIVADAARLRLERGTDWVIVVSGMYQPPDFFLMLRSCGFKLALLCTESPYDLEYELRACKYVDAVLTNERTSVADFREVHPHVAYLPHAWHPGVHAVAAAGQDEDVPAHDVVFVGTYFQERVEFMSAIDWTGIDLGLYGGSDDFDKRTKAGKKLRPFVRGGYLKNARTAALYRKSKVGLNLHRTSKGFGPKAPRIGHAESLNPRCYELAATGCYFVSDRRGEATDVFGDVLDTFETPAECEALIRRALNDQQHRSATAQACYQAVQPHTWKARAETVINLMTSVDRARQGCAA